MQYKDVYLGALTSRSQKVVNVVQSDSARSLHCYTDLDLSTITAARIYVKKPDNTETYSNCTIDRTNGYIVAPLESQSIAAVGAALAQLQCTDSNGYISTFAFVINVNKSLVSSSAIPSSNEYRALEQLIDEAETWEPRIQEMEESIDSIEDDVESLKTVIQTDNIVAYSKSVLSGAMGGAMKYISGKTVAFNQLVQNGNFASASGWAGSRINIGIANNTLDCSVATPDSSSYIEGNVLGTTLNHKYCVMCSIKYDDTLPNTPISIGSGGYSGVGFEISSLNVWIRCSGIFTRSTTGGNDKIRIYPRTLNMNVGDKFHIKNVICIDLTQMFGAGNEPSTVAEVEAIIGTDYIPYNAGSLESAEVSKIVSVGKNRLSHTHLRGGMYNAEVGTTLPQYTGSTTTTPVLNNGNITFDVKSSWGSLAFVSDVLQVGKTYKCKVPFASNAGTNSCRASIYTLDKDYKIIRKIEISSYDYTFANVITIANNECYIAISIGATVPATITLTQPQIELGSSATSYSPYKAIDHPIPQAIQDLDGYGWSAGSVYNEVNFVNKKFIKRVGSVDLGTLNWGFNGVVGGVNRFSSSEISSLISGFHTNVITSKYTSNTSPVAGSGIDKTVCAYTQKIFINDSSYSDAPSFKEAMQGVILYYELATPIETDISTYIDGTTIEVENGGTITFAQDGLHLPIPNSEEYWIGSDPSVSASIAKELAAHSASLNEIRSRVNSMSGDNIPYKKNSVDMISDKIDALLSYVPKYGAQRSLSSSNPTLTRIWDSVGLNAAVSVGSTPVDNDFDSIYPWSMMRTCNITIDNGKIIVNAYDGDPNFKRDGTNGQVVVEIPSFYYCPSNLYDGYETYGVCAGPVKDWIYSPKRYIGCYNSVQDGSTKLKSVSGQTPLISTSLTNFRTKARATDGVCQLIDIDDWNCMAVLFCTEFATINTQSVMYGAAGMSDAYNQEHTIASVISTTQFTCDNAGKYVAGQGICIGTAKNGTQITAWVKIASVSGTTITLETPVSNMAVGNYISTRTWPTGDSDDVKVSGQRIADNRHPMVYRGVENLWGNIWQWVDGMLVNDYQGYICTDKSKFDSSITSDYHALGYVNAGTNGYAKTLGFDANYPCARITSEVGASSSTYYSDYYYQSTGLRAC
ncbi:MAG: BppU family phage baseplate upper protein, partial [Oscillospiraceae bacterium]|nr:BppU family phage baseplate upper protein [Candidatus Limimonas egerieequi]